MSASTKCINDPMMFSSTAGVPRSRMARRMGQVGGTGSFLVPRSWFLVAVEDSLLVFAEVTDRLSAG
jgi:hypothetical protein